MKGTPSHASRTTKLNPVPHLVASLDRIAPVRHPHSRHARHGQVFSRQLEKLFRTAEVLVSRRSEGVENAKGREWILSDVYWNAILRNTISHRAPGLKQDERHPRGSDGGAGHPPASRHEPEEVSCHTRANRQRHRGTLHDSTGSEAPAGKSNQHRPIPRHRAGVPRSRPGRAGHDAHAHCGDRPAHIPQARHHHI